MNDKSNEKELKQIQKSENVPHAAKVVIRINDQL
jgi:hypothetical protein